MAVLFEKNPLVWKKTDGIYVAEQDVPGPVKIIGSNICKVVGQFPWGPKNKLLEIGSPNEVQDKLLGGHATPADYGGYRALKGKQFGPLRVVAVEAQDAVKATITIRDAAEVTVDTLDDAATYNLEITDGAVTTTYPYAAQGGDAAADVLEGLEAAVAADADAVVAASYDAANTKLLVTGNGSESWSLAVSADATGVLAKVDPSNAITYTAKYSGAPANGIGVVHQKTSATEFKAIIYWGNVQQEVGPFEFDADGMTQASAASDYFDVALHVDAGSNPETRTNAVEMAGGDDGTLVDTDWTGTGTAMEGLRVLEQAERRGYVFAAEYTSSTWIAALEEHLDLKGSEGGAQADTSNDFDTNATAAQAIANERLEFMLHRVVQIVDGQEHVVDLTPFYGAVWSQIPPHFSVADFDNRDLLGAIKGLPDGVALDWPQWRKAQEVGGVTLERLQTGGWKFHASITSDPLKPSEVDRRLKDVVGDSIGYALLPFQNKPAMQLYVDDAQAAIEQVLEEMQSEGGTPAEQMIADFFVEEKSQSATTLIFNVDVEFHGEIRYLVANLTAGAGITITERAA